MKRFAWKTFAVVVTLALVLAAACALAESGAVYYCGGAMISGVRVPVEGMEVDYGAESSARGCAIRAINDANWKNGVRWYDKTAGKMLKPGDTFAAGHTYRVYVALELEEGYVFFEPFLAMVNDMPGSFEKVSQTEMRVTCDFKCAPPVVSVTDIEAPKIGRKPDYDVTVSFIGAGEKYAQRDMRSGTEGWMNGVRWVNADTRVPLDPNDTFAGNAAYVIEILFKPASGRSKLYGDDGVVPLTPSVNGSVDSYWQKNSPKSVAACCAFPKLPASAVVGGVNVLNLDAPAIGQTPDYTAYLTTGDMLSAPLCVLEDKTHDAWQNGVSWYDVTDGEVPLLPSQTFELGHAYKVVAALVSADGYTFAGDNGYGGYIESYATLGGARMETRIINEQQMYASYTYGTLLKRVFYPKVTDIDPPAANAKPDHDVTLAADGCALDQNAGVRNGIEWYDMTASRVVGEDETFIPGHQYYVRVYLEALPGYTFCDEEGREAVGSIVIGDGLSGTGTILVDERHASYARAFSPVAMTAGPAAVTGLDAPVAGGAPDYSVYVSGEGVAANASGQFEGSLWYGVEWIDETDGVGVNREAVFQPGHQYTVRVHVRPNGDYSFVDGNGQFTLTGTINGEPATGFRYNDGDTGYLSYTFPPLPGGAPLLKVIDRVLLIVDAPQVGKTPGSNFILDPITTVCQENMSDDYHRNGVSFIDQASGEAIRVDGVFEAGRGYEVRFSVYAKEGFTFYDGNNELATRFAVNSKEPSRVSPYDPDDPQHAVVSYVFYLPREGHLFPDNLSGFVEYDGGLFLVSGGDVVTEANGVVQDPDNPQVWYFCAQGQAQRGYYGLAEYGGKWFFIRDGDLNTAYPGLVEYDGARFMVAAGRLLDE
ncbi:MAG: hypothetical protein IKS52_02315, partial [Clostridia bacterium]|nr:hypothetical protein [Clostridia bacterium]